MQLTGPRRIREALAVATSSLLALDAAHAGYLDYASPWQIDAATLVYSEQNRVNVVEPIVHIKKEIGEGEFITAKFIFDTMSGATPNGATPSSTPQTFSSASGKSTTATAAHELPLVSFTDARAAVSVDWELPMSRILRGQYNAIFSRETDYSSLGIGATLLWDVNNKHTTFTTGVAVNIDQVSPTGGMPTELSPLNTSIATGSNDGDDGKIKNTHDLLVGVTQVLTRRSLMQLNYSYGKSSGYLTDPYKIISVVDGTSGVTQDYLHEKRPAARTRNALYWKTVYQLPEDVVHLSYRYYWDDWGIKSGTVDLTYRLQLGAHIYLEPHYRYYTQTAANFFMHAVVADNVPDYASADLRLAALQSITVGLRVAHRLDATREWGLGIDSMHQTGDAHPADAIGVQKNEALFSDLKALSLIADFSMKF